jgi:hypothetical protein
MFKAVSKLAMVVAVATLAVALSGAALARGGGGGHGGGGHGGHGGGGHGGFGGGHAHFHGGGHFAGAHHFGGGRGAWHGGRSFHQARAAAVSSGNVRSALNSLSHHGALRSARILGSPVARAQLAAGAAVVGWHGGVQGWWRHPNGGYGWVGPLFWPFAYYDIYDYTIWGDGAGFWGYGYLDIYAGLFGPYGYDGLSGYQGFGPPRRGQRSAASFAQMCADDSREIAGLPIDRIAQAIEPTEAQRAALDDLAGASIKAAQTIRTTCPTEIAATAPGRLAVMQRRIEGITSAVELVRPPLEKLYGLLDDEQKARFNALAEDERKKAPADNASGSAGPGCGAAAPSTVSWPADEIETRLHPNDTQHAALKVLQDATARAADTLKTACQPADILTPTARLEAIAKRLDTMLQAVSSVRTALEDFYATLSDEQKAQFEAIGPRRTS